MTNEEEDEGRRGATNLERSAFRDDRYRGRFTLTLLQQEFSQTGAGMIVVLGAA
jgi:hypothetical protein